MISVEEAVLAYAAAFNENDPAKCRTYIEKCFAEHGTILSSYHEFTGHDEIAEHIVAFRQRCPNDRAVLTSGIEHHHNYFRFTAKVIRPDGTNYSETLDVGEFGADGRITKMIAFHGPLPTPDPTWPHQVMDSHT